MIDFSSARFLLRAIRSALGDCGLIGLAWDGEIMKVSHARPETGRQMFVMTFDAESDYELDGSTLVAKFAEQSIAHFGERIDPASEEHAA